MTEQEFQEEYTQEYLEKAKEEIMCLYEEADARGIKSPIERMLFMAIKGEVILNHIPKVDADVIGKSRIALIKGFEIIPQYKIGKYYIDFRAINHFSITDLNTNKSVDGSREVLIECDSQKWHERSEEERRYEKDRDRFLQKKGYKVFHYTGKEILNDPRKIAREILNYLGCEVY